MPKPAPAQHPTDMTMLLKLRTAATASLSRQRSVRRRSWPTQRQAAPFVLTAGLLACFFLAVQTGPMALGWITLWDGLFGADEALSPAQRATLFHIRLPRACGAIAVGATLAVCGAAMQALFRNPLADPGLVGVTSGAAVGGALFMKFGATLLAGFSAALGSFGLPVSAFACGLAVTWVIQRASLVQGRSVLAVMLLAGIAINALGGAAIGLILFFSDDSQLRQFTFWTLGNVGHATWTKLAVASPLMLAALLAALKSARSLNAILLGEAEAQHLGINLQRLKRALIFATAAGVGASVSVAGGIGFIGLVVPHIIRHFISADHRCLLPGSALLGAALLVFSDLLARTVIAPVELPLGVVTAVFGAPFFLWLLFRERSRIFF